ncbi:F-box domain-containing protein [Mycena sanguinolenta]|uniref:F-box domain-containing protein n=1 Tax=Mycena sanguinolenta TaxID=230812 RepID=A0A8H7CNN1_9AGAR|nr:F-box domain-containing protein [Mycena sanguinolenta]
MVLTRGAYRNAMEAFRWLPNEILVDIIQHSTAADQASLSRVSRLFHDLCLPVLYRIVQIKDKNFNSVILFCSAMIEKPSRAAVVRSFTVDVCSGNRFNTRQDLLLASLKLMSTLDHLSLSLSALDDRHCFILLEESNFPQLRSCEISAPSNSTFTAQQISDAVALFLTRHSTLKRFHLQDLFSRLTSTSIRVSLPNLEYYGGSSTLIPAIDATGLKKVQLTWSSESVADVEAIIIGVSAMTKPDFPFVFSHIFSCPPRSQSIIIKEIVTFVSKHMRHTKTLRLEAMQSPDTIAHVTECLPCFTGLVYLSVDWISFYPPTTSKAVDRITVEGWGKVCPTLEACCLNSFAWRKVNNRWKVFPVKEFGVLAGLPEIS